MALTFFIAYSMFDYSFPIATKSLSFFIIASDDTTPTRDEKNE